MSVSMVPSVYAFILCIKFIVNKPYSNDLTVDSPYKLILFESGDLHLDVVVAHSSMVNAVRRFLVDC